MNMQQGAVDHRCQALSCHCSPPAEQEFCSDFCKDVETSEDTKRCGCGHSGCDATPEIGNEQTFDSTQS